jgi:diguanylate cyclase (GGDEF)-like protein/putative nucleotidyltransferase with HDIG domain
MPSFRFRTLLSLRAVAVLACTLALVCAAIVAVGRLQDDATGSRDAQLKLVELRLALAQVQQVPWGASPDEGDDPNDVRAELAGDQKDIENTLAQLSRKPGLPERAEIMRPFKRTTGALWQIFDLVRTGHGDDTSKPSSLAAHQAAIADQALAKAAKRYRSDSVHSLEQSRYGSAAVILLLFGAFAFVYRRATRARRTAERLAGENRRLLAASQLEARTDPLTQLGNRRALLDELASWRPGVEGEQLVLGLFDLDGFKQYNDTFGHPAGDSLLARLGARLEGTMEGIGEAFRMGGDEFCILASVAEGTAEAIAETAAAALSEEGVGFAIGCSYGTTLIPTEATRPDDALRIADQRMYQQKDARRISPGRQSANVLVTLLAERNRELERHTVEVATLAELTAALLELPPDEVERIRLAAQLHDVGKAAVPDGILTKPGELDEEEWEFIHRHTVVGERIIRAAPSLAAAADLVRSHHERLDGSGYPDGLRGDRIPLGARIVGACDAFCAMVSDRPHRPAKSVEEALAELRAGAGSQFDRTVVAALAAVVARGGARVGLSAA